MQAVYKPELGSAQSGCAVAQQQVLDSHSASSLLPYRLIRIPEKYQEASVPVCSAESSLSKRSCSSSGWLREGAQPWCLSLHPQLPHPASALGKPHSPTCTPRLLVHAEELEGWIASPVGWEFADCPR